MKGKCNMYFFDDEDVPMSDRLKELAEMSIEATLDYLEFEYEVDVELILTNNSSIQAINKEHRNIDMATDVLSFPMIDWLAPCDYDFFEQHIDSYVDPDSGCILLGDIILSMDKVIEQANEYGHSIEREFVFLIVHSMLHLFGYDHMTDLEEDTMIQLQKTILEMIDYEK